MPEANLFLMFTQRLNALGVPYMVSGSVAVIIYGEPRLTHDVDLIVVLDRAGCRSSPLRRRVLTCSSLLFSLDRLPLL
jgi:hypothetical protein